jgi:CHASE2 domain-containing sensor protein
MSANRELLPIDSLRNSARTLGSFDFSVGSVNDTVYAYTPQQTLSGYVYEAFSLAVLREYLDKLSAHSTRIPRLDPKNDNYLYYEDISRQIVLLREPHNGGLVRFAFRPSSTFQTVSFFDVYEGTYDSSLAKEAIVLVGASASALHDEFFSPIGTIP